MTAPKHGRVGSAETGSRASTEPCSTVSAASGFDPARGFLDGLADLAFGAPARHERAWIKCVDCGRFLSVAEMTDGSAKFSYTPLSEWSDERCEWSCARCKAKP